MRRKVLRRGAWPAFGVYANVFMGDADTRVEYRIDEGEWKPMKRVAQPDPRLLAENVGRRRAPTRCAATTARRKPILPRICGGRRCRPTWLLGEHRIEVRVHSTAGRASSVHETQLPARRRGRSDAHDRPLPNDLPIRLFHDAKRPGRNGWPRNGDAPGMWLKIAKKDQGVAR